MWVRIVLYVFMLIEPQGEEALFMMFFLYISQEPLIQKTLNTAYPPDLSKTSAMCEIDWMNS